VTDSHADKPHLPVTAMVWSVRLTRPQPATVEAVIEDTFRRWGRWYYCSASRTRKSLAYAEKRGWLTVDGLHVTEAPDTPFDTQHDPTMLTGHQVALRAALPPVT
jgi:hypothetical protein